MTEFRNETRCLDFTNVEAGVKLEGSFKIGMENTLIEFYGSFFAEGMYVGTVSSYKDGDKIKFNYNAIDPDFHGVVFELAERTFVDVKKAYLSDTTDEGLKEAN